MISDISASDLEAVKLFSKFFEVVASPDKYSALVANLNKALDRLEDTTKKYKSVQDAEKFLAKAEATAAKAEVDAKAAEEILDAKEAAFVVWKADKEAETKEALVKAQALVDSANAKMILAENTLQAALDRQTEIEKMGDYVSAKEAALATREAELNDKAAKIQELLK